MPGFFYKDTSSVWEISLREGIGLREIFIAVNLKINYITYRNVCCKKCISLRLDKQ